MQYVLDILVEPSLYDEKELTVEQRQERYIRPTEYRGRHESFLSALHPSGNCFEHFYLHTAPPLDQYRDLFLTKKDDGRYEYDDKRIIWLESWASFISLGGETLRANFFDYFVFLHSSEELVYQIYAHFETQQDAVCSCWKKMFNSCRPPSRELHRRNLRVFSLYRTLTFRDGDGDGDGGLLETVICQSSFPGYEFNGIELSAAQCRILATRGKATKLTFKECTFENDGVSFGQAYTSRMDVSSGPIQLNFIKCIPETFVSDLFNYSSQHQSGLIADNDSTLTLSLYQIPFDIQSVALTEVRQLALVNCSLQDSGNSLVASVREGRGPRSLTLFVEPLWFEVHPRLSENYLLLIDSLRGNEHLETLHLSAPKDLGWMEALSAALPGNNKLTMLVYQSCSHEEDWPSLLAAVATHPTLRSLYLNCDCNPSRGGEDLTQHVVQMFRKTHTLEHIDVNGLNCDLQVVDNCLDCNELSKLSKEIKQVESTRAGILAEALSRVNRYNKASFLFVLLSENVDQIALCTAGKQNE